MKKLEPKPIANITPYGLRMQPELKASVDRSAKDNNRSMNAEIVERLEKSFSTGDQNLAKWIVARQLFSRELEPSSPMRMEADLSAYTFLLGGEFRVSSEKIELETEATINEMLGERAETLVGKLAELGWTVEPPKK